MMSTRRLLTAAIALLPLAAASGIAHAQTKWDMPTAYPATNFHTENIMQFASDVDKASGGKLKIQVHANASLFKAPEIKRAVQGGQAQAGEILLANYQNEWQIFGTDSIPFLADSYPKAYKLYQAQKPALQKRFNDQNMVLLYSVVWPTQGLYVKNKINTLADLKGAKWRAYSPATGRIAELLQAQPVTIQAAELSAAMATGVIDSFMTSGATGYDTKTYEHIKNYYNFQAWLPKNAVFVNKKAFDALDKPTQDAVMKAAADAETRGWKISEQKDGEYLALLQKNGMEIIQPQDSLKADMRKVVGDPMLKEWLEKAGPEGAAIVDAYRK
jgi:TRAP-type C4-dicarboxylate transport system substrate-binding protein